MKLLICLLSINILSMILSKITIVEVSPMEITTGVISFVSFNIKIEGNTSFKSKNIHVKITEDNLQEPCINSTLQGSKIVCPLNLKEDKEYDIYYESIFQNLKIKAVKVALMKISPSKTLKTETDINQAIKLTFNRLPLPSTIKYQLYSISNSDPVLVEANCEDFPLRLEKICMINFNSSSSPECEFFIGDEKQEDTGILPILNSSFSLLSVNPPTINQNLTTQLVVLEFQEEAKSFEEIIYFDTQNAKCEPDDNNLNCNVLLKTSGFMPIYIGGVKTSHNISVIKVEEDDLLNDLHANLNKVSLILLIIIFFFA